RQLAMRPEHVAAALGMMANWDLHSMESELPRLAVPLALLVADHDRTIPPSEARRAQALVRTATIISLGALGHLAHEEQPLKIARLILNLAEAVGASRGGEASG